MSFHNNMKKHCSIVSDTSACSVRGGGGYSKKMCDVCIRHWKPTTIASTSITFKISRLVSLLLLLQSVVCANWVAL